MWFVQNFKKIILISNFIFVHLLGTPSVLITGHEDLDVWAHECFEKVREYSAPACEHEIDDAIEFPEPIIEYSVFENNMKFFIDGELHLSAESARWVDGHGVNLLEHKEHSFAQACCIDPTFGLVAFGDIHGSIHSFLRNLMRLREFGFINEHYLLAPNCFFIFLGDYVDRGRYSVEVLYTLLRLKIANPRQVFLIRGNHEILRMIARYGFLQELTKKYVFKCDRAWRRCLLFLDNFFSLMPSVLFIGCGGSMVSFLQFCHGGLGIGYDKRSDCLVEIEVNPLLHNVAQAHTAEPLNFYLVDCFAENGFMWNDFCTRIMGDGDSCNGFTCSRRGSCIATQGSCLRDFFSQKSFDGGFYGVNAIIRGHGHRAGGVWQLHEYVPGAWRFLDHEVILDGFVPGSDAYPIYTIMSGAEGMGVSSEGFATISFNLEQNKWHLRPYFFEIFRGGCADARMAPPVIVVTHPDEERAEKG